MDLTATLASLCWLSVFSCSGAFIPFPESCNSQTQLFQRLSADMKEAAECGEVPQSGWSAQQTAALLIYARNLTDALHRHQQRECPVSGPGGCPAPEVPANGGLVCMTVEDRSFCKPLCNPGYDFAFLRRSRLVDECSRETGYRWNSQYVGGNRLAECREAAVQVSGSSSAYFPKDQDCLTTKSSRQLTAVALKTLATEIRAEGVQGGGQGGGAGGGLSGVWTVSFGK
ncbi:uncharacterized protein ACNS7B_018027 [Menidia menidia]